MDAYDEQVKRLTESPDLIPDEWDQCEGIFDYVVPDPVCHGHVIKRPDGKLCGCPLMIRGDSYIAWTDELTSAICTDEQIPTDVDDLRPEHLPHLADLRRRIDKKLASK